MTSYIYFVQANGDGPIKIGFTGSDPRKRMVKIQSDCPWPVRLLGAVEGTMRQEKSMHRALARHKAKGEWFEPHHDVLAAIQDAMRCGRSFSVITNEWSPKYDHPLCIWLARNRIRAIEFAHRIGVTPGAITGMYRDGTWIGRDLARRIYDETNGEVTPTDFMLWNPPAKSEVAA